MINRSSFGRLYLLVLALEMPLGPNLMKNRGFESPPTSSPNGGWAVGAQRNGAQPKRGQSFRCNW